MPLQKQSGDGLFNLYSCFVSVLLDFSERVIVCHTNSPLKCSIVQHENDDDIN